MSEPTLFPGKLWVTLQEINQAYEFIFLGVGVEQELAITDRTTARRTFALRNSKDSRFLILLSRS